MHWITQGVRIVRDAGSSYIPGTIMTSWQKKQVFPLFLTLILIPSLRIINACRFRPARVSYMKPVGQKHVLVKGKDGKDLKVGISTKRTET